MDSSTEIKIIKFASLERNQFEDTNKYKKEYVKGYWFFTRSEILEREEQQPCFQGLSFLPVLRWKIGDPGNELARAHKLGFVVQSPTKLFLGWVNVTFDLSFLVIINQLRYFQKIYVP